jgi:hypothetical protein
VIPPARSAANLLVVTPPEDAATDITREGAGTNSWWHRFRRRKR